MDNHSTDGTVEYLARQHDVELIANKRNMGFGYANNQAFARTTTPYVLGLNNDTVLFPQFLSRLLFLADKYPEYAEFGVSSNCIGAKHSESGVPLSTVIAQSQMKQHTPADSVKHCYGDMGRFVKQFSQKNNTEEVTQLDVPPHFVGGWCFLVRTEAVRQAGGLFDTRFKVGFYEDADLSWRLHRCGYLIGHIPSLYIHHFNHISFDGNTLKRSDRAIARANAARFADKWSDTITEYLRKRLSEGRSWQWLTQHEHIIGSFFGRNRDDYDELEQKVTSELLQTQTNVRDFLLANRKSIHNPQRRQSLRE